ncbi:hypothetical protein DFS34DRAFT_593918 [Phlyctochytrium arcticum]|nr:hypothetical protein DFS34DRAFT_593918 [Phlyctochytrium arcticum]
MELHLTLKSPYRQYMTTDLFRITTSQGFARIQHIHYDPNTIGVLTFMSTQGDPVSPAASLPAMGFFREAATDLMDEVVVTDKDRPLSTELTYITTDALVPYLLLLVGSQTCNDREITIELIRTPAPDGSSPSSSSSTRKTTEPQQSSLKTMVSLTNLSAPNAEAWSKHRDWHLRAFGLGTEVPPTMQEINVRGRLARGRFLADLDGFSSVAKRFDEVTIQITFRTHEQKSLNNQTFQVEPFLQRIIDRYVKVFLSTLNKHDDTPLTLKQLAFVSCPRRHRNEVEGWVRGGHMDSPF